MISDDTFETRLAELLAGIEDLPPDQQQALAPLIEETRDRQQALRQHVTEAHNALDDWRVAMKYRVFDGEIRRREQRDP